MKLRTTILITTLALTLQGRAQDNNNTTPPAQPLSQPALTAMPKQADDKKWYDKFAIRGYMQFRQNNLVETNDKLVCAQCDGSWGGTNGVAVRRARIVFQGQVYENIFFKIEADFATGISGTATSQNFTQVRDAYVDVGLTPENELKVRLGQSKVPYGFENLQSSGVRLLMDRSDAINSALLTERDLGAFLYYTPKELKKLYADLVNDNYKGSGDYGILAFGIYNGQTANRPEQNKSQHVVARATYPFKIGSQIIEPGIQGYTGKYVMYDTQLTSGVNYSHDKNYLDQRAGLSFVLYPRPFGIQAEYNIGKGPQFDKATQSIATKSLTGGYTTFSYRLPYKKMYFSPYTRVQYYNGGRKFETDARSYTVHQFDLGLEFQLNKYFELTAEYCISDRDQIDFATQNNHQKGNSLRLQAQVNFF